VGKRLVLLFAVVATFKLTNSAGVRALTDPPVAGCLRMKHINETVSLRTGTFDVEDTSFIWEKPLGAVAP
jgi:hypothetical protein